MVHDVQQDLRTCHRAVLTTDEPKLDKLLRLILAFVLRQQWSEAACFACDPGRLAVGGFSESMASPLVRIDYAQHALSAMVRGKRALGWERRELPERDP